MTHLGLSPDVTRAICWALLHFLWQGLALALLLSVALSVVRRAAMRYALGVATLVLMVAAPAATYLVLRQPAPAAGTRTMAAMAEAPLVHSAAAAASARVASVEPGTARQGGSPAFPEGAEVWLLEFWLAGVVVLSMRALGGLWVLERMRRRETEPVSAELVAMARALESRLGLNRALRYCQCRNLDAPAVIGWLRPVVLLPVSALTGLSPEQLGAVIAHELAHIRRHDAWVNLFQTGVETLLFYHPAVWWVNAQIRAEREHCCDDVAVSVCGGVPDYARALMLMEEWRRAPRLAMASNGSRLRSRVLRLTGLEVQHQGARSMGLAAASLCLALVVLAGTGLMGTARGLFDPTGGISPLRTGMLPVSTPPALGSVASASRSASPASLRGMMEPLRAARAARAARALESVVASAMRLPSFAEAATQSAEAKAGSAAGDPPDPQEVAPPAAKESYIDGLNSVGLKNLDADQLISLKVQHVTPEYIRQIHAAGLTPTVDELIGMKVQGVTPEYISAMRAHGLKPTVDDLIAMKVQGVTPDYLSAMHAAGVDLTADSAVAMRVQGVTPEYIHDLHAEGVDPKPDELIGLKVQGVTAEYIHDLRAEGVSPNSDELVSLKVQGVTPQYVREIHAAGLKPSGDDLIAMKVQGVTPEYIRDMHAAGLSPTADEFIGLRTQGVTPEFVRALQTAGLGKLSADDYIEAKERGITPEFVEKARSHGIQGLTLEKLIGLKDAGVF
jgi:beta-lactamase regulating signal transducer with metallopeptidase domain